jgi:hypothetical protein
MVLLPLRTDSEFLAAARASAGYHRTAVLGFHTAAESVRLRAVAIIRLKGAFRHFIPSTSINQAGKPEQMAGMIKPERNDRNSTARYGS